jgi:hypothetical protein
MSTKQTRLGFGDTRQTAQRFHVSLREATRRARSGEWPSWIIGGRRVFDLDQIASREQSRAAQQEVSPVIANPYVLAQVTDRLHPNTASEVAGP